LGPWGTPFVIMPTFYNTRWPLLTELLESKGWTKPEGGALADLSFVPTQWAKFTPYREVDNHCPGNMSIFSRIFLDLFSNKRSCAVGMREYGLIPDVMPPTYVDTEEWESVVKSTPGNHLWFFKEKNASNSKGIAVTRTVEGGKRILTIEAAGGKSKEVKDALSASFDPAFFQRFSAAMREKGIDVPLPTLETSFNGAMCSDPTKIEKAMNNYIIQRGVERPLLIKEGRKFCLRIYVLAVVRPLTDDSPTVMDKDREVEVYVSELEIARPQKAAFDPNSIDPASQFEDSNTLYTSVSDGTNYPVERWRESQFPQIKSSVKAIMSNFTLVDPDKLVRSDAYQSHFASDIKKDANPVPVALGTSGRINVLGFDFMFDEDDKPWLIEINGICNLRHSANSARDTFNKTQLASAVYDLVLAPCFMGAEVKTAEHLHRVL
jgi:hypothetical protein